MADDDTKPYYDEPIRQVLATMFGEESLPLLEQAARVAEDLKTNPVGRIQQCGALMCEAIRIRTLVSGLPSWSYTFPIPREGTTPDRCAINNGYEHAWKQMERKAPF